MYYKLSMSTALLFNSRLLSKITTDRNEKEVLPIQNSATFVDNVDDENI